MKKKGKLTLYKYNLNEFDNINKLVGSPNIFLTQKMSILKKVKSVVKVNFFRYLPGLKRSCSLISKSYFI